MEITAKIDNKWISEAEDGTIGGDDARRLQQIGRGLVVLSGCQVDIILASKVLQEKLMQSFLASFSQNVLSRAAGCECNRPRSRSRKNGKKKRLRTVLPRGVSNANRSRFNVFLAPRSPVGLL